MISPPVIREYKPDDKEELLNILRLNVPTYFAESEIDDLANYLDSEIERYFVVEIDRKLVGAGGINFADHNKIGKISWDFIHPDFQGFGIGRKLLTHRLQLIKSMESIEKISVRTSQLAYQFYEKSGFTLLNISKDYWAEGFDMYEMVYRE